MASLNEDIRAHDEWDKACRAEEVARFYLKLQGYFTLNNFALHKDLSAYDLTTEADLLAVRLMHSCEHLARRRLADCPELERILHSSRRSIFLIVEVKSSACSINASWDYERNPRGSEANHLYAIKRAGLWSVRDAVEIAKKVAEQGRWENSESVVQYLCVGAEKGATSGRPTVLFRDIARFMVDRFLPFLPLKIPERQGALRAWGQFGYGAAEYLKKCSSQQAGDVIDFEEAVERYVNGGSFDAKRP